MVIFHHAVPSAEDTSPNPWGSSATPERLELRAMWSVKRYEESPLVRLRERLDKLGVVRGSPLVSSGLGNLGGLSSVDAVCGLLSIYDLFGAHTPAIFLPNWLKDRDIREDPSSLAGPDIVQCVWVRNQVEWFKLHEI